MRNLKNVSLSILCLTLLQFSCKEDSELEDNIDNLNNSTEKLINMINLKSFSNLIHRHQDVKVNKENQLYEISEEGLNEFSSNEKKVDAIVVFNKDEESFNGIGVYNYSFNEQILRFDLFENFEDISANNKILSYIVDNYVLNDIMALRERYFKESRVMLFYPKVFKKRKLSKDYNDLALHLTLIKLKETKVDINYLKQQQTSSVNRKDDDVVSVACGWTPGCLKTPGNKCNGHSCRNIGCGAMALPQQVIQMDLEDDQEISYLTETIRLDKYYNLKDEVLLKSDLGKAYTDVYCATGKHFIETQTVSSTINILSELPNVNRAIDKLINEQQTKKQYIKEEVVIGARAVNSLNNIISTAKSNSSSSLYKEFLTLLQNDLTEIGNKNKTEIYEFLEIN